MFYNRYSATDVPQNCRLLDDAPRCQDLERELQSSSVIYRGSGCPLAVQMSCSLEVVLLGYFSSLVYLTNTMRTKGRSSTSAPLQKNPLPQACRQDVGSFSLPRISDFRGEWMHCCNGQLQRL